jgi:hypothetical protein
VIAGLPKQIEARLIRRFLFAGSKTHCETLLQVKQSLVMYFTMNKL